MRTAAAVDANQPEIVQTFRELGCTVRHLHQLGKGCPDLLVGVNGFNVLVETKMLDGKLTKDQIVFIAEWRGDAIAIVRTRDDVVTLVNYYRGLSKQPRGINPLAANLNGNR